MGYLLEMVDTNALVLRVIMHIYFIGTQQLFTPLEGVVEEELVGYKHCCGIFTTLHKCKVHYSRAHSTLVPSVACQITEGKYLLLTTLPTY